MMICIFGSVGSDVVLCGTYVDGGVYTISSQKEAIRNVTWFMNRMIRRKRNPTEDDMVADFFNKTSLYCVKATPLQTAEAIAEAAAVAADHHSPSEKSEKWIALLRINAQLKAWRALYNRPSAIQDGTTSIHEDQTDFARFYECISTLAEHQDGGISFRYPFNDIDLPARGVYFLFEEGEFRSGGYKLRITRVGTHGVKVGSKANLRTRLRTHVGTKDGKGNHRASVFRRHVGQAILARDKLASDYPMWDETSGVSQEDRHREETVERWVSDYMRKLRFIYLDVPDEPGKHSDRSFIERNSIGLLSQIGSVVDPSSDDWLGQYAPAACIGESGLWNVDYVFQPYRADFLDTLDTYVKVTIGELLPKPNHSIAPHDW